MTGDLVERLRQRLTDLETVARAAIQRSGTADWEANSYGNVMPADPAGNDWLAVAPWAGDLGDVGVHIAANDPAHVLRTIQAHRKIIELADEANSLDVSVDNDRRVGRRDEQEEPYCGDEILRALAAIYLPDIETGDTPT